MSAACCPRLSRCGTSRVHSRRPLILQAAALMALMALPGPARAEPNVRLDDPGLPAPRTEAQRGRSGVRAGRERLDDPQLAEKGQGSFRHSSRGHTPREATPKKILVGGTQARGRSIGETERQGHGAASRASREPDVSPAAGREYRFDAMRVDGIFAGPDAMVTRSSLALDEGPLLRLDRSFVSRSFSLNWGPATRVAPVRAQVPCTCHTSGRKCASRSLAAHGSNPD
jgi:hypothetical protein